MHFLLEILLGHDCRKIPDEILWSEWSWLAEEQKLKAVITRIIHTQ